MTTYIDPNSGAAPQPGGWAGPDGMELGHALAADIPEGVEQKRQLNEALYETPKEKSIQQLAEEADAAKGEPTDEKAALLERVNATANPKKYLAEADEGDSASSVDAPEEGDEEKAVDAKALETEAVNMEESPEDKGQEAEEEPEEGNSRAKKKAPAKKAAAKKSS